jgi:hypothetical protein
VQPPSQFLSDRSTHGPPIPPPSGSSRAISVKGSSTVVNRYLSISAINFLDQSSQLLLEVVTKSFEACLKLLSLIKVVEEIVSRTRLPVWLVDWKVKFSGDPFNGTGPGSEKIDDIKSCIRVYDNCPL